MAGNVGIFIRATVTTETSTQGKYKLASLLDISSELQEAATQHRQQGTNSIDSHPTRFSRRYCDAISCKQFTLRQLRETLSLTLRRLAADRDATNLYMTPFL
jgi:hypothetical protein